MRTELPLHDASFSGIVLRDGGAELFFAQADGTPRVVRLTGVDAMQMDDFRPGNITVLFETVSAELPREAVAWDRLYPAPHPAAAQVYQDRYAEFLARKHSAIAQGRLTFVRMVPAYGADLLAVCERVEFADG